MFSGKTPNTMSDFQQAIEQLKGTIETVLTPGPAVRSDEPDAPVRLEVAAPHQSPIDWLMRNSSGLKVYWKDRDGEFEMAGAGVADLYEDTRESDLSTTLSKLRGLLEAGDGNIRYYGGCRFDSNGTVGDEWQSFGRYWFVLPRFELLRTSSGTKLACNLFPERDRKLVGDIVAELQSQLDDEGETSRTVPNVTQRSDEPDQDQWRMLIKSALRSIEEGSFKKIVLARKTRLSSDSLIEPLSLMREVSIKASNCYCFYFQPIPGIGFLGATPERLYRRKGTTLNCEAIAGTRPRSQMPDEDRGLADELLSSEKEAREHRFVIDSIVGSLSTLSGTKVVHERTKMTLLRLERVQHLITPMKFELSAGVTDADLLQAMHPTAAVGGYPQKDAVSEIRKLEGFDRGWYAGPVGWLGKDESEFAVAIRSALVKDNSVNLYGGAGIVEGSDADKEWEEIDSKIAGYMKVLMP